MFFTVFLCILILNFSKGVIMKLFIALVLGVSFLFASVDINSASAEELMKIKGIGAKKAQEIVAFRAENCFSSVDELTKVKGIGKKFLEKHRAELSAGTCKK